MNWSPSPYQGFRAWLESPGGAPVEAADRQGRIPQADALRQPSAPQDRSALIVGRPALVLAAAALHELRKAMGCAHRRSLTEPNGRAATRRAPGSWQSCFFCCEDAVGLGLPAAVASSFWYSVTTCLPAAGHWLLPGQGRASGKSPGRGAWLRPAPPAESASLTGQTLRGGASGEEGCEGASLPRLSPARCPLSSWPASKLCVRRPPAPSVHAVGVGIRISAHPTGLNTAVEARLTISS